MSPPKLSSRLPQKVISGGQTGADHGALIWAKGHHIVTGGFMPKHFRTEVGPKPKMKEEFGMWETSSSSYPYRTEKNVVSSDVTILFGNPNSRGCKLTARLCERYGRPYFVFPWNSGERMLLPADELEAFGRLVRIRFFLYTLNVAGNRESRQPGITKATQRFLDKLFFDD